MGMEAGQWVDSEDYVVYFFETGDVQDQRQFYQLSCPKSEQGDTRDPFFKVYSLEETCDESCKDDILNAGFTGGGLAEC